jgi:hypothetical protein
MLTEKVSLGPAGKDSAGESRQGGPETIESAILVTSGAFLGPGWGFHHLAAGAGVRRTGSGAVSRVAFREDRREFFGGEKISKKNRSLH